MTDLNVGAPALTAASAAAAAVAGAAGDDFWTRVLLIALGVACGTFARWSTWVREGTDEVDRRLVMRDVSAIGLFFMFGLAFGAATGWMPELIGAISGAIAFVGVGPVRRILIDGGATFFQGVANRLSSSSPNRPDGDAP